MQETGTDEDAEMDELRDAETVDLTEVQQQLMEDMETLSRNLMRSQRMMSH